MKFNTQYAGLVVRCEMSYTNTGLPIVKWTMPYDVYNSQTKRTDTQWLNCVAFGERFEKLYNDGYLVSGRTIQVNGAIKSNAFLRRDNTAGASIEMTVGEVGFVQISKGNENSNPSAKTPDASTEYYDQEKGTF